MRRFDAPVEEIARDLPGALTAAFGGAIHNSQITTSVLRLGGSIVVFDWLEMSDTAGAFAEGPRRQVDVMVKDSKRFATTGGWGFQRFVKDSKTELAASPTPQQCFACHDKLKKDGLILSSYRQ